MKDLNRFEYLQIAAALMPEAEKIRLIQQSNEAIDRYQLLSKGLWDLANSIREEYCARYENKTAESELKRTKKSKYYLKIKHTAFVVCLF